MIDECWVYFRQAIHDPAAVPPWSVWWTENGWKVERFFPIVDFVRLKHRKLKGVRQIMQIRGELPADYAPPHPRQSGSCGECGERLPAPAAGPFQCPACGMQYPETPA